MEFHKRRYWSDNESEKLKALYAAGKSIAYIAKKIGVSESQVYAKANYLNLVKRKRVAPNQVTFTKREIAFIKKNFHSMTNPQLAKKLKKTLTVVRNKCRELGLLHMQLEYWTPEQVEYLKANYKTKGDTEIAADLQKLWPKKKCWTNKHIDKKRGYLGLKRTVSEEFIIRTGRFNPEQYKDFDGKQFPQGKKRIWYSNGKAYWMVKVGKEFVKLHIHNYVKHRGPIPEGMKLRFKDGNTLNWRLSNMQLVTKSELARIVSKNNHASLSDRYVAGLLAFGGNNRQKIDRDFQKLLLQNPALLEAKRQQIQLNRNLKKQKQ